MLALNRLTVAHPSLVSFLSHPTPFRSSMILRFEVLPPWPPRMPIDYIIRVLFRVFQTGTLIIIMAFTGFVAAVVSTKSKLHGPVVTYDYTHPHLEMLISAKTAVDNFVVGFG